MGTLHHIFDPGPRAPAADDPAVIEACRRGDREALELVLGSHGPYLERLLIRLAGPSLAEDLLQLTFVAAVRAFPRFRGEAQVKTWLTRIAVRTAHAELRRAHHRRRASGDPVDDLGTADDGGTPETRLAHERALSRVQHHLAAIGAKKRIAFVLHVVEGHPMEEVAAIMDASVSATKSRVFWARKELLARSRRDPELKDLVAATGETAR